MAAEVENATKVLHDSVSPVTAIVGGAKVSDKIQLLERLIDSMDNILIGGGMAYTFIAAKGGKIGKSLV
jgi:phosphoglycerate kinase